VGDPRHRSLTVAKVVVETPDARSIVLDVPPGLADWFRHRPGQFVTVRVPMPEGQVARCYSLSSAPGEPPAITVKRTGPASAWLVDNVAAGTVLDVLQPAGMFTPRSADDDLLLVAAGSGITPVMSILRYVLATGTAHAVLVYANRDPESVIFDADLRVLEQANPDRLTVVHWLESERGLPDAAQLREVLEPHAGRDTYVCGPTAFMAAVDTALRGITVPRGRVHVEKFVSLPEDPFAEVTVVVSDTPGLSPSTATGPQAGDGVIEVELDGERRRVPWPAGARMLDVLVENGLAAPSSCRQGLCGACTTRLEAGEVSMVNNDVLEQEDLDDGYILACQSLRVTPEVKITYD
jgi:3-ketosteroid 9alpha-monooxygenase subunit B